MSDAVLITGGNGFIGHYIADEFKKAGFRIYCIGRNKFPGSICWDDFAQSSLEHSHFAELYQGIKFKYCFHLAASSHVPFSIDNPYQDFLSVLPGTANLLNYLVKKQPECHLIIASSAAVYGNPEQLPINENARIAPLSPYGVHKALTENLACYYSSLYGLRVSVMRIFSAYGNGLKKQLLWDLANKILTTTNGTVELFGDGSETRDFIHARDIAQASVLISERHFDRAFEVFNVADSQETSVRKVAETLVSASGIKIGITFNSLQRPGDPMRWRADCTKLKQLGFKVTVDFEKGAADYYAWASRVLGISKEP